MILCMFHPTQSLLYEQQKQLQQMHKQMETLAVPVLRSGGGACGLGVHRALSRTRSLPASTSITPPETALSLTTQDPASKPRFTTGESDVPMELNVGLSTIKIK